jgi:hypothetical protein
MTENEKLIDTKEEEEEDEFPVQCFRCCWNGKEDEYEYHLRQWHGIKGDISEAYERCSFCDWRGINEDRHVYENH